MKALLTALGIFAVTALTVTPAAARGNDCTFPGSGVGGGGSPGDPSSGTFPGGGATGGSFPGGSCGRRVDASEPFVVTVTGAGLIAAAVLARRLR